LAVVIFICREIKANLSGRFNDCADLCRSAVVVESAGRNFA
jgi:hypothetical protein